MTAIPSPEAISNILTRIDEIPADQLESEVLDFKRWLDAKKSLAEAVKMAVCFANAEGGVVVFGVKDDVRGRQRAITGCSRYDLDTWRRGIYEGTAARITQLPEARARDRLEQFCHRPSPWLERRGKKAGLPTTWPHRWRRSWWAKASTAAHEPSTRCNGRP
ncbi:helix-turn-helix domain-containing protein [Desulfurivibrio sp. D14AmB]|uniref:AlbA family DNA-binding domain-containing protein n=1 Tax=Desulfurivibrio sp. D14AmB TaxID=3374370 RepID=UPI00376EBFC9